MRIGCKVLFKLTFDHFNIICYEMDVVLYFKTWMSGIPKDEIACPFGTRKRNRRTSQAYACLSRPQLAGYIVLGR